jgi:hypothetical protein
VGCILGSLMEYTVGKRVQAFLPLIHEFPRPGVSKISSDRMLIITTTVDGEIPEHVGRPSSSGAGLCIRVVVRCLGQHGASTES